MLYISIILILCGIIILVYSISVEVRKYDVSSARRGPQGSADEYEEDDDRYEENLYDSPAPREKKRGILAEEPAVMEVDEVVEDWGGDVEPVAAETLTELKKEETGDKVREVVHEDKATAVLYEDSSNIIDYSLGNGRIDPSLEEYSKIVRIGKGDLFYEKSGLNFNMMKKFYRYDFHRFEDFKAGDDYIAITLKGGLSTKLFILENNMSLIKTIADQYRTYSGS